MTRRRPRLATLRPVIGTLPPTLATLPIEERKRGRAGDRERMRILRAHGVECARCHGLGVWRKAEASAVLPLLIVDHIVPLALGGADDDANKRVLCEPCHLIVTGDQFGRSPAR